MSDLDVLESNLLESFSRVKSDILTLSAELNKLSQSLNKIMTEQSHVLDIANGSQLKELESKFSQQIKSINDANISNLKDDQDSIVKNISGLTKRVYEFQQEISSLKSDNKKKAAKKEVIVINSSKHAKKSAKNTNGHKKKKFVASRTGKKFHVESCIFAKNIKPKSKRIFKSKNAALNKGYKPCYCVLK